MLPCFRDIRGANHEYGKKRKKSKIKIKTKNKNKKLKTLLRLEGCILLGLLFEKQPDPAHKNYRDAVLSFCRSVSNFSRAASHVPASQELHQLLSSRRVGMVVVDPR